MLSIGFASIIQTINFLVLTSIEIRTFIQYNQLVIEQAALVERFGFQFINFLRFVIFKFWAIVCPIALKIQVHGVFFACKMVRMTLFPMLIDTHNHSWQLLFIHSPGDLVKLNDSLNFISSVTVRIFLNI